MPERKVAVVLSGGGAKGAYEAGALKAIVRFTDRIDVVSGASIGAINAAVFAHAYEETGDLEKAAAAVADAWRRIESPFKVSLFGTICKLLWNWLRHFSFSPAHLLSFASVADNAKIIATIASLLPEKKISELKRIELAINATDLTHGRTVTFCRENDLSLREAVLASSCIPVLFPSRRIGDSYYVDGGIFNNTPLKDVLVRGATDVFIVALKPSDSQQYFREIEDHKPFDTVFGVSSRLMELVLDKIMYEDLKTARRLNEIVASIEAFEEADPDSPALRRLKDAIKYDVEGRRMKAVVNFYEVAPARRLEPPGTLGFDQRDAIEEIMRQGEEDAAAVLAAQIRAATGRTRIA